ncbi:MAG TPA: hypothetical protein DCR28_00920 [Eubacterium sp.]|nr:hypothetical protein [Eubacterium sp.]
MNTRKEWKKAGKKSLKAHYWIFITVCLLAAVIGTEYEVSLEFFSADKDNIRVVKQAEDGKKVVDKVREEGSAALPSTLDDRLSENILVDLAKGNADKAEKKTAENEKKEQKKKDTIGGVISLNHQRGVLANIVNKVSSGAVIVTIYSAILSIVKDNNWASFIFVSLAALMLIAVWIFLINVYRVIMKRIFMEGSTYEKVQFNRFLFLSRVGRHFKVSKAALKWTVYETLWSLTIVGYFIKHYAYFMTPYILAENPDMTGSEAITLSRQMMYGHKWECFKLDFSFILWDILGWITYGLATLFFVAAYRESTYVEYYKYIRKLAFDNKIENAEMMNDKYIFAKADKEIIKPAYADVREIRQEGTELPKEKGVKGFFAKWFGIVPVMNEYEWDYRRIQTNKAKIKNLEDAIDGKSYPRRLFTLPEKEKGNRDSSMLYTRRYCLISLVLMFFVFCFIGWGWEVILHLVEKGEVVNRGVNYGPWLPIYGTGGIGALLVLTRIKKYPVATFFASIVFCGVIEYITGASLLAKHGARFWNYSGYFLNINGHVCAEGLLVFGVACLACIYVVAPVLDNRFSMLSLKTGIIICAVLLTVFIADNIYSGKYPNLEGMSPKSREQYLKDNPDAYKHQLWNVLGIKNMQKKYKIKG